MSLLKIFLFFVLILAFFFHLVVLHTPIEFYLYGLVISGLFVFPNGDWQIYLTADRKNCFSTKTWFNWVVFTSSIFSPFIVLFNSRFRQNKKYLRKTHKSLI